MRNTLVDPFEDIPRSVVVTANEYAAGSSFPVHAHRRGQFAFASRGTISVATPEGRWLVPPQRACWVPAGVAHEMTMRGPVTMLNAFVSLEEARDAQLPAHCYVYGVSALLKQLLEEAIDLPAMYDVGGRAGKLMSLLVAEIASMPRLSLHAPLPSDPRLVRACRMLLDAPSIAVGLDMMAAEVGMSRRTLTRLFRVETGVSFAEWRQQVCLLSAIERLSGGEPVTRVALDLGYASPGAFSFAFRRVLGEAPSQYLETRRAA
ncbi:helix-turn-helix transcriptional regulator [Paraburkholderia sp. J10-1]|uniref:AraC family transcriptional regulator n=1 Tax=Paraburkholderia sp. J10-1 TaxID=2805430 RepID=UPI002AB7D9F4|nr:helix-turn-helix transcriptional regulator [Paraburkholderia sp. J10-1]